MTKVPCWHRPLSQAARSSVEVSRDAIVYTSKHRTSDGVTASNSSLVNRGFRPRVESTGNREEKSASEYISALKQCCKTRNLESGKRIHQQVREHGLESNIAVANTLVDMYSKCRCMAVAHDVFQRMISKNVVTWTCLILGYAENAESLVALDLFARMDCEANHVTYLAALKACTRLGREIGLGKGMTIHEQIKQRALDSNIVVANTLVDMYSKCGSMRLAREVFEKMALRDVVTWNCLILGYVENGESMMALELFSSMDCEPNHVTFVAALKACTREMVVEKGMAIHERVRESGLDSNIIVANTLVDMYSKCGKMRLAREVFDGMLCKDVVTWTCLILGYVENEESSVALDLFTIMNCEPDHVTCLAALKACAGLAKERESERQMIMEKGMAIHEQVKQYAFDSDIAVASTLVDIYSKCGNMRLAREVFDSMVRKDVVAWTCLILGYMENRESSLALEMFTSMDCEPNHVTCVAALKACAWLATERDSERQIVLEKGIAIHEHVKTLGFDSDIVVGSSLVDMYRKCGKMQLAREVFDKMIHKDVVTWSCLIVGYVENGDSRLALTLFTSMSCEPNEVTCVAALKACMGLPSETESDRQIILEQGMVIHRQVKERGFDSNMLVTSTLVGVYSKCGNMQLAREVFERLNCKDAVTWNCLILGYAENGESLGALDLFTRMDCEPDHVTYIAVLKACAGVAALAVGRQVHGRVCKRGLEEDAVVATVLVDFYGKCGCMTNATEVFNTMHSPDIVSWNALITGYSSLGDTTQIFSLVKGIQEAGLKLDAMVFNCILTACSHAGMVEESETYLGSLEKHGVRPTLEHYTCMVDMLGRANKFDEAVSIVNNMPFKANQVTWMALLSACRKWNNLEAGKVAFDALVSGDKNHAGAACVVMGDIYRSCETNE